MHEWAIYMLEQIMCEQVTQPLYSGLEIVNYSLDLWGQQNYNNFRKGKGLVYMGTNWLVGAKNNQHVEVTTN